MELKNKENSIVLDKFENLKLINKIKNNENENEKENEENNEKEKENENEKENVNEENGKIETR